ncbi:GntR family transcriptional regulator [Streptomyces sp. 372A]
MTQHLSWLEGADRGERLAGSSSRNIGARRAHQAMTTLLGMGVYPPGSKLPRRKDLCTQLDVSQLSLRDALHALADERLIDALPTGEYVVRAMDTFGLSPRVESEHRADPAPETAVEIVWERIVSGAIKPGGTVSIGDPDVSPSLDPLIAEGFLVDVPGVGIHMPLLEGPQIRRLVWARIVAGVIKPGRPISGERPWQIDISSAAQRSALDPLIAEGFLVDVPGVGIHMPAMRGRQLLKIVRARIDTGVIKPGDYVYWPLRREFGIDWVSAWSALGPLVAEGLLAYVPRRGLRRPHHVENAALESIPQRCSAGLTASIPSEGIEGRMTPSWGRRPASQAPPGRTPRIPAAGPPPQVRPD